MWFFGKGKHKISVDLSGKKAASSMRTFLHKGASFIAWVLLILALLLAYHFYSKYRELRTVSGKSQVSPTGEKESILASVDRLILLPLGEEPRVAKVKDLKSLEGYIFFRNATVGDEVIVYCKAQLSILYSPTRDKLIEVNRQALSGACQ